MKMRMKKKEKRMEIGTFFRIFMICIGIYVFIMTVLSLAKRKMTDHFCLLWSFLSILLIAMGILVKPSQLDQYFSTNALILLTIGIIGIVWGFWFISTQVSILMRRNQELAMQVSLLNQDSEILLQKIKQLEQATEEKE